MPQQGTGCRRAPAALCLSEAGVDSGRSRWMATPFHYCRPISHAVVSAAVPCALLQCMACLGCPGRNAAGGRLEHCHHHEPCKPDASSSSMCVVFCRLIVLCSLTTLLSQDFRQLVVLGSGTRGGTMTNGGEGVLCVACLEAPKASASNTMLQHLYQVAMLSLFLFLGLCRRSWAAARLLNDCVTGGYVHCTAGPLGWDDSSTENPAGKTH